MSREIEFRGKDVAGQWHYGLLAVLPENVRMLQKGHYISNEAGLPFAYQVRPETVGQYTGLKDCKARKIYERDIVRHSIGWVGKVHYIEGSFEIEAKHQSWPANYARCGKIEVIGNIDDNPELLRGEADKV